MKDIVNQTRQLSQILRAHGLVKEAADQTIRTISSPMNQKSLGADQTSALKDSVTAPTTVTDPNNCSTEGEIKDSPLAANSLKQKAVNALRETGTAVNAMKSDETPTGQQMSISKTAAYLRDLAHSIAMQKQASAVTTGTEVMNKVASLNENSAQSEIEEVQNAIVKIASTNPLFSICRERILMDKMAADISEAVEATGESPEAVAAVLDAAAAENPEMMQDLENEATAEAIADTADIEASTATIADAAAQLAANASTSTGQEISPEEMIDAAMQVVDQAEADGVEPEDIVQAAAQTMMGSGDEEELMGAIQDAAAEAGISPDELVQALQEEEGAEEEDGEEKQAGLDFQSPRAAYAAYVMANR